MKKFIYTEEQLNKIVEGLNQIEVKGRNNHICIEVLFQLIENGIEYIEPEDGDE